MPCYRKRTFWLLCAVLLAAIAGAVCLLSTLQPLALPATTAVLSVEMEQWSAGESQGRLTITDPGEVETILTTLAAAREKLGRSVSDYPSQTDYLVVRLILPDEMLPSGRYCEIETTEGKGRGQHPAPLSAGDSLTSIR